MERELPSLYELRVPTVTLGNVEHGHVIAYFAIVDREGNKVVLERYNPVNKKWEKLKGKNKHCIPCTANFIHLQSFGAQWLLKHEVLLRDGLPTQGLVRMVISGRDPVLSTSPNFEQHLRHHDLYQPYCNRYQSYDYKDVASALVTREAPTSVAKNVSGNPQESRRFDHPDRRFEEPTKQLAKNYPKKNSIKTKSSNTTKKCKRA